MPLAATPRGIRRRLTPLAVAALAVLAPTTTAAGAHGGAAGEPRPAVRREALSAMRCAQQHGIGLDARRLAVIDYTLSSRQPRLWVLDLERDVVLFEEHVAHGQGSGFDAPSAFSDRHGSRQSSLGLFLTGSTYIGNNGYSLRLVGLSRDFNESAADRLIVIHGADYVNPQAAERMGRLGRSARGPRGWRSADPVTWSRRARRRTRVGATVERVSLESTHEHAARATSPPGLPRGVAGGGRRGLAELLGAGSGSRRRRQRGAGARGPGRCDRARSDRGEGNRRRDARQRTPPVDGLAGVPAPAASPPAALRR
jgi:hypothetical protein